VHSRDQAWRRAAGAPWAAWQQILDTMDQQGDSDAPQLSL